ncbi:MAG: methyl-accepting chemotaxis protein, partial [Elusimicrobia bacterium]|nr:methyl-accepting chemotaxis protein [Elusimicrobiota bacterium]
MTKDSAGIDMLTAVRLLRALKKIRRGDFTARLSLKHPGVSMEIAETFNDIIEVLEARSREFERISQSVGKDGILTERISLGALSGSWKTGVDSINSLIDDLVQPTTEVARVIGAAAKGDLSQTMPLQIDGRPVKGAFLQIANTINTMVDQLNAFASEVTRVAREVGTEGKLGGQARVKGVAGVWKDL